MIPPNTSHDRLIWIEVPGARGLKVAYDPSETPYTPGVIQNAVHLIGHWLTQADPQPNPSAVRLALRHLDMPHLLGETALAYSLFDHVSNSLVRGNALRRVLLHSIQQLDPGPNGRTENRRPHLILHSLYVLGDNRLHIAKTLGLSERHYQRELYHALAQLTAIIYGAV